MTWIQKRSTSRPSSRGPADPASEAAPPPALPPFLKHLLETLPNKPLFRVDEVAMHLDVSKDLIEEFYKDGKLIAAMVSPRNLRITRQSICDYILNYVKPI